MPFTLVAFKKTPSNTTLDAIQPIADQHVTVRGDDLTIPELNQLVAAIVASTAVTQAQLQSPSLRVLWLQDIGKFTGAADFANHPHQLCDHKEDPIPLVTAEKLNVYTVHTAAVVALLWLADAAITPVHGDIRTIRATPDSHGVAWEWTNSTLSFAQTLPAGRYQVVGVRAFGTNLLAARLVLVGYAWRPGVPAVLLDDDDDYQVFRRGRFGAFGEFEFDQPPSVDLLCHTASEAEAIYLDLIQVRAGR